MNFSEFFQAATGNTPYPYQIRLACGEDATSDQPKTLEAGTAHDSRLIAMPTGLIS